MVEAVTSWVGIEHWVVLTIGQIFQTRRHTVTQDGHCRPHHSQLLLQTVHSLVDRIKTRSRRAQWTVPAVSEIADRKRTTRKFLPHPGFKISVVVLPLHEGVTNQQDPVTVFKIEFTGGRPQWAARQDADGRKAQKFEHGF